MGAHDEVKVLGAETVFLHGGKKPSKMFEMASIDEDGNISSNDIAIAVILIGVFPRVMKEVLLYKGPWPKTIQSWPVAPFFIPSADSPYPKRVEMSR
jgi:hypothetical protein